MLRIRLHSACYVPTFSIYAVLPLFPLNCSTLPYHTGLKAAEVATLCQGAQSSGPAQCFVQARGLGNTAERVHLCNGAASAVSVVCDVVVRLLGQTTEG